jgi:hypothetical protein
VRDGSLDGGSDGAEVLVEPDPDPGLVQPAAGRGAERDDGNPVDAGVAEVGGGVHAGDQVLQARSGEGVRVVAGAGHGRRADRGEVAGHGGGDLDGHPRVPCLAGEQARDRRPVPDRADGAVHQQCSLPGELARAGHQLGEHLPDQRPQQVPAPGHGGLADPEDGPGDLLGDVLAHQRNHHRHRAQQADRGRAAAAAHHVPGPPEYPQRQLL